MKKIYLIAGESSGDYLGSRIIDLLSSDYEFYGVGGDLMKAKGFSSLFPYEQLSLLGFLEILPHIFKLRKLIELVIQDIIELKPDLLITIDSPGFNYRVVKGLRERGYKGKIFHYVAPTVWAYKPERAKKFAIIYDRMITILPFECKYFESHNLACDYIGHPLVERIKSDGSERDKFSLIVMPGSRSREVRDFLPIMLDGVRLSAINFEKIYIPINNRFREEVIQVLKDYGELPIELIDDREGKSRVLAKAQYGVVKAGTSVLEASLSGIEVIACYKVNRISAWILRRLVKIKNVTLVNILLQQEQIVELLQENFTARKICNELRKMIEKREDESGSFSLKMKGLFEMLGGREVMMPSEKLVEIIKKEV